MEAEDTLVISFGYNQGRLSFSDFRPEATEGGYAYYSFMVAVEDRGLRAAIGVQDMSVRGGTGLADYFESLAEEWRGWDGEKTWAALEGQLRLACTTDRTGHARLVVKVGDTAEPDGWRAEAVFVLDVMDRERIAREVRRFFSV